ncbi:HAD family phosphatase [Methanolobus sp. ZRKC2]|uniref:HAD family hydrolase n=1 Tax=Methanolobus sp. ZRKC2 TaxID=3125783 RepID=UPI003255F653
MLSSLIFDMDGVLLDSMPSHADAWVQVCDEWGIHITRDDVYEIEGANHFQGLQWLFNRVDREIKAEHYDMILKRKVEIFSGLGDVKPFDGMDDCLKELKGSFRLALVTGSERVTVNRLLNEFFPNIFEVVVCGDDILKGKPSPEPYIKAVDMLGIEKDECMVIENAPMGVESAKRAGLYCIGVPTYVSAEKLSDADVVLQDHLSLPGYLLEMISC